MLVWQLWCFNDVKEISGEDDLVEFLWTVVPTFLVCLLCFLNLQCLGFEPCGYIGKVIKVIGRQWFWSYEVVDCEAGYDSLMRDFIDSVDKPLRLSYNVSTCVLVTSSDVIHSFALPELNLKVDAIPGRVNQTLFYPDRLGIFVGYCRELCGAGHAYMPIVVEVTRN